MDSTSFPHNLHTKSVFEQVFVNTVQCPLHIRRPHFIRLSEYPFPVFLLYIPILLLVILHDAPNSMLIQPGSGPVVFYLYDKSMPNPFSYNTIRQSCKKGSAFGINPSIVSEASQEKAPECACVTRARASGKFRAAH